MEWNHKKKNYTILNNRTYQVLIGCLISKCTTIPMFFFAGISYEDRSSGVCESPCLANEYLEEDDGKLVNTNETVNDEVLTSSAEQQTAEKRPVVHDTLIRMIDCPNLSSNKYFTSSVPADATFALSEDEWDRLRPTTENPKKLQAAWTNIIATRMASSNNFCAFNFQKHYLQKLNSRKRNYGYFFKAYGKCMFSDCSCKCVVLMKKDDVETLE